jgi:hypothetical protein
MVAVLAAHQFNAHPPRFFQATIVPWMRLSITGQDLHVLDCKFPHRGVSMSTVSLITSSLITEPNGNVQLFKEFSLLRLSENS